MDFHPLNGKFCYRRGEEKEIADWVYSENGSSFCSDLIVYEIAKNSWHIKPITVKCINEPNECSNKVGNICVPKCCPHNQVLDIDQSKRIKCRSSDPNKDILPALSVPIYSPAILDGTGLNKIFR